ncbi:hypothetical protein PS2_009135 [Malus domestica]
MNIVPASMKNTLSAIYNRGLIGAFHDWRQPFSTYPRTYDLLHANRLFSHYKNLGRQGCELADILLEMDRMIRPQGFIIIRDEETITSRIQDLAPKFLWEVELHTLENKEKKPETVLICRKKFWGIIGNATEFRSIPNSSNDTYELPSKFPVHGILPLAWLLSTQQCAYISCLV